MLAKKLWDTILSGPIDVDSSGSATTATEMSLQLGTGPSIGTPSTLT